MIYLRGSHTHRDILNILTTVRLAFILIIFELVSFFPLPAFSADALQNGINWGPYRGANVEPYVTESDIAALNRMGANVIRLSFDANPLMSKKPPYKLNMEAFKRLDMVLEWCKHYHIGVIIDPHTTPGTKKTTSTSTDDAIWYDRYRQQDLIRLWRYIALRYRTIGDVIVGYDLLNEPAEQAKHSVSGVRNWNELASRLVYEIRKQEDHHWIIIETAVGYSVTGHVLNSVQATSRLKLPNDPRIIVSVHIYLPIAFTHQGIYGRHSGLKYPGFINGKYYNYNKLLALLYPARVFQLKHRVPIFVGEFSASIYSGASGNRYLSDLIRIFEKYNWSWTYHTFRAAHVWDPEYPWLRIACRMSACVRSDATKRMLLLREYWNLNHKS